MSRKIGAAQGPPGPRPKIVNRSGYVLGDNGQRVYGMDAEHALRMRAKQDPEWQKKVAQWVSDVTGVTFDVENAFEALRSGEVLVQLLNVLKPGTIKRRNKLDASKGHNALASNENIKLYLAGCVELLVPPGDIFLPDDLRTGRNMMAVCQNIASLSRTAKAEHDWQGEIVGPQLATKGPKTWQDVEVAASMFVDDYCESDMEAELQQYKRLLEEEQNKTALLMSRSALQEQDVAKMKERLKTQQKEMDEAVKQGALRKSAQVLAQQAASVEKSSAEDLRQKRLQSRRSAFALKAEEQKSQTAINEWQQKVKTIKKKHDSRVNIRADGDDEEDDDLLGASPSKQRRYWISRRALKIIILVQFVVLLAIFILRTQLQM